MNLSSIKSDSSVKHRKIEAELKRIGEKLLSAINWNKKTEKRYFEIVFLGDQKMKALKKRFLKKTGKNHDVLAFPEPRNFPHPGERGQNLGEIYLNSRLLGDFNQLVFLTVHGLLHLLGFTHDRKRDTLKMERIERQLIEKAGYQK
jgi:rRNA maturation RNase YbeY